MNSSLFAIVIAGILASQTAYAQPISTFTCSPENSLFSFKYVPESDQGQAPLPEFPVKCKLHAAQYIIKAKRGPYSERHCGAQPPVSIWLSRGKGRLVNDAVFGENCFGGPSINEIEIVERGGVVQSMKICISNAQEDLVKCRELVATEVSALRSNPITQAKLDEYIEAK